MDRLFGRPFTERCRNHWASYRLRGEALAPLQHTQVVQLRRWRSLPDGDGKREPLLLSLLQSVNAIARGVEEYVMTWVGWVGWDWGAAIDWMPGGDPRAEVTMLLCAQTPSWYR